MNSFTRKSRVVFILTTHFEVKRQHKRTQTRITRKGKAKQTSGPQSIKITGVLFTGWLPDQFPKV